MSDFIIFIIGVIVFALRIYFAFFYTERYGSRYGSWRLQDIYSTAFDPIERVRDEYDRRLQIYYSTNKPRTYLKNNKCELRLITDGSGVHFYCKEKTNGKSKGRFFEVKGESAHVSTMWGILDMGFDRNSTYSSLRSLYMRLNQTSDSVGGLRYFYEPWLKKYPNYNGTYVQNEYCRA